MRIYKCVPEGVLRITIKKVGEPDFYFSIADISKEDFKKWLIGLLEETPISVAVSPFVKMRKTSVTIRESIGGKNGALVTVSFYGLSTAETHKLISDKIENEYTPNEEDYKK